MSKARTLADFISDGSEFADGTISVAEVSGAAPLASPTFTGNVDLGDDVRIRLGDDNDFQIYHDSSSNNSVINEGGSGNLTIQGNELRLQTAAGGNYFRGINSGSASIFHANSKVFETAADGVDITGDVGATTATITGKTTTDELDLNAIAATISDTAVDIFVYDTRKDSDGGAWRKRTQHTSWYNETLNTATRGSRKEFPTVAVIVVDNNGLYIYDGDDPDMPMWMKANDVASGMVLNSSNSNAVTAKNGIIALAGSSALWVMHFVDDRGDLRNASRRYDYKGNIEQRNDGLGYIDQETSGALANAAVNDVAMTVLPNAPIDAATGLPVPTIAVATAGGVSVIKDDGTVVDSASTTSKLAVAFSGSTLTLVNNSNGSTWVTDDYSSDSFASTVTYNVSGTGQAQIEFASTTALVSETLGATEGLTFLATTEPKSASMHCNATSSYNTGWMNGDIKLATLSDTDATNVTGSELVTNGTFDSNTSGWTAGGGATLSVVSNALRVTNTGTSNPVANQTITGLTVGATYTIYAEIKTISVGSARVDLDHGGSDGNGNVVTTTTSPLSGSYTFTATSSNAVIQLYSLTNSANTGAYAEFDNVSLRLAEEDRSVNGNGLQVFGTVTKSAVATGADLVASYHSSGHYMQPYNSDFDFGTGDFCHMFWVKWDGTTTFDFLTRQARSGSAYGSSSGWYHKLDASGSYLFGIIPEGGSPVASTLDIGASGFITHWTHITVVRRNGVISIYRDGVFKDSDTNTTSISNTAQDSVLYVGTIMYNNSENTRFKGSLALVRISATAPSPEQIKKIYEDEKVLFQENAKATLYGSSDAVTALAYDDSTNLLHVGTSAGRSVFQGLRRVDNTTTAVGAAISASNGLVADE